MQLDIDREVAALRQMTTSQLCQRYAQLFGEDTRTTHKPYLIRRIAWRLQALAEGDLSERARRRAAELANDADVRRTPPKSMPLSAPTGPTIKVDTHVSTDARLPAPGTAIIRKYTGRTIHVVVLADGFEFAGARYKSLSAVAKAITGSHVNGLPHYPRNSKVLIRASQQIGKDNAQICHGFRSATQLGAAQVLTGK